MKKLLTWMLLLTLFAGLFACGAPASPASPAASETPAGASAPAEPPHKNLTAEELAARLSPEQLAETDFTKMDPLMKDSMELDVYILAGQSNAAGSTRIACAEPGERDKNVYENVRYCYYRKGTDGVQVGMPTALCAVREGLGFDSEHVGPELGMAQVLNDRYATPTRKAIIYKEGAGGTSILKRRGSSEGPDSDSTNKFFRERGSWAPAAIQVGNDADPNRPSGLLARNFTEGAKEMVDELVRLGFRPENIRFVALCWLQGETDRDYPTEYKAVFPLLIDELRTGIAELSGQEKDALPLYVSEISNTFSSATEASVKTGKKFNAALAELAQTIPNASIIQNGELAINKLDENGKSVAVGSDTSHWNYRDILCVGVRFAEAALGLTATPAE